MKLEYLYDNNNNLKYTLKSFFLFMLSIILIFSLLIICFEKKLNCSLFLMFMTAFIIIIIFYYIVFLITIILKNNYKRKKFISIKNNGRYITGIIIDANYINKGHGRYIWLCKKSGEIIVKADNKTYKINNIDFNSEFKLLKQKLNNISNENRQQYINFNERLKNDNTLGDFKKGEITVGIYILDDMAVADLNTIKYNL